MTTDQRNTIVAGHMAGITKARMAIENAEEELLSTMDEAVLGYIKDYIKAANNHIEVCQKNIDELK